MAGALDAVIPSRRQAIWSLPAVHRAPDTKRRPIPGQQAVELAIVPTLPPNLPDFTQQEREQQEWQAMGFSPSGHPMRHHREALAACGIQPCTALQSCRDGESITLAGLSLCPHRPPVPSGEIVVFLTLEDETGLAQVTVQPGVYEQYSAVLLSEPLLVIQGRAAVRGSGYILIATRVDLLAC